MAPAVDGMSTFPKPKPHPTPPPPRRTKASRPWRRPLYLALQWLFAGALAAAGYFVLNTFGPEWLEALKAEGYVVEHPEFAWGLVAIPLFIVIRAHTLSDLPRVQQGLSIVLKTAFVACLVASLVDVKKVDTHPKAAAVVYVVDVSESVPDAMVERARQKVEEVWKASLAVLEVDRPEVRLVVFGNGAEEVPLVLPAEGKGPVAIPPLPRLPATNGVPATNAQAGLRLAFALLPEGKIPSLVVVTDGLETEGALAEEVDTAKRFGIPVHYLDLTDVPRPNELAVIDVDIPRDLRPNKPFNVTTKIMTTAATKAHCEVQVDGIVEVTAERDLPLGESTVTDELRIKEGGDKRVAVSCKAIAQEGDHFATNNRFELPIKVPERPKVLYVEGEARYARNLAAALEADYDVEYRGARGTPGSLADAKKFDLIFISDVPRVAAAGGELMSQGQMRVLEQYARSGGGLIFAGGENSFGPGGYSQTILEREVFPVRLDVQRKQDTPGLALMLVIDRSGSMAGPKIELAKQAAIATLDVLQPDDLLGICAFDSRPGDLVGLQRASNRFKITDAVSKLRSGGGTNIFGALSYAYDQLIKTDAKIKHIILLTDGQSNRAGVIEMATQAALDKITISAVAVGMGSDQDLLRRVAEAAGGRYYFTNSPQSIPKLFLKETSEVTRKALVEDRFVPRIDARFRHLQMFRGVDLAAMPPLVGYVSTRAKPRAEVLMTSHIGEPVMARWRLGLGKVVVWTSDVKNKWAHYWLGWSGYAKFWRQVVGDTLRVETEDPSYGMVADIAGNTLTVGVDAIDDEDRFIDEVLSEVTVVDPNGKELPLVLAQTAAGRYEGTMKIATYGPYTIKGKHTGGTGLDGKDVTHRSFATVAWPFPAEHLAGTPNLTTVEALARVSGGTKDPSTARLFDPRGAHTEEKTPWWPTPLPYAVALLVADILLRRVRMYGRTQMKWADVRGSGGGRAS